MMCRRKLSPRRRKLRKYIAIILSVCILLLVYYECAVKAQLTDIIVREMQTVSQQAVNTAVDKFLSENFDVGEKLSEISFNSGSVAAVSTNPSYVNSVKTEIIRLAQQEIDAMTRDEGLSVHLGSFTGLSFLTNIGPTIRFDVESAQTISCEFESSFESAGINQSVHHVTMNVTTELLVYNPYKIRETIRTTSSYEIAQTVIVGSVPSYSGVVTY